MRPDWSSCKESNFDIALIRRPLCRWATGGDGGELETRTLIGFAPVVFKTTAIPIWRTLHFGVLTRSRTEKPQQKILSLQCLPVSSWGRWYSLKDLNFHFARFELAISTSWIKGAFGTGRGIRTPKPLFLRQCCIPFQHSGILVTLSRIELESQHWKCRELTVILQGRSLR